MKDVYINKAAAFLPNEVVENNEIYGPRLVPAGCFFIDPVNVLRVFKIDNSNIPVRLT